jgi:hypothetical protein
MRIQLPVCQIAPCWKATATPSQCARTSDPTLRGRGAVGDGRGGADSAPALLSADHLHARCGMEAIDIPRHSPIVGMLLPGLVPFGHHKSAGITLEILRKFYTIKP